MYTVMHNDQLQKRIIAVDNNKVKDCIVTVLTIIIISHTKCLDRKGQTNNTQNQGGKRHQF